MYENYALMDGILSFLKEAGSRNYYSEHKLAETFDSDVNTISGLLEEMRKYDYHLIHFAVAFGGDHYRVGAGPSVSLFLTSGGFTRIYNENQEAKKSKELSQQSLISQIKYNKRNTVIAFISAFVAIVSALFSIYNGIKAHSNEDQLQKMQQQVQVLQQQIRQLSKPSNT